MATVTPTVSRNGDGSVITVTWANITTANRDGAPVKFPEHADRTVQLTGTLGGGAPVIDWEGSNDGTNYETLNDPQGSPIGLSALGIEQVLELTAQQRPYLRDTTGDGTTDLTVIAILRRQQQLRV
jgi:hypothetical protein